jgi:hypothetical protein
LVLVASAPTAGFASVIDDLLADAPSAGDWHQALLHSMGLHIETVSPALFSFATVGVLRRLLGFRDFFRHAYAV